MLLIVDGSSILVTCFYGNLPFLYAKERDPIKKAELEATLLHDEKGRFTNAIFPMMRIIDKILRYQNPSHIAFAFDKSRDTFRKRMYPLYKGNRGIMEYPLFEQFVNMENILTDLGMKVFLDDEYEADDFVGSLVSLFEKEDIVIPIRFMSHDHDLLQLITPKSKMWLVKKDDTWQNVPNRGNLPKKVIEVTEEECLKMEGVYPWQIPDLKGIRGDTADNIPGIKGINSAAAPLLREYKTIEGIYDKIDSCNNDKKKLKELSDYWRKNLGITRSPMNSLLTGKESGYLSKKLATIKKDIPLNITIDDLRVDINPQSRKEILLDYGMKSLI